MPLTSPDCDLRYLVLSGLMIPFTVVLVPVVQLLADVGWVNTYQGLIVPNLASALGAFLQNWNNFLFPLVVTSSEKLMMVSQGLTILEGTISKVSYNLLMAAR